METPTYLVGHPGPRVALVIPANDAWMLGKFFERWKDRRFWTDLVVVEDGPRRTFDLPPDAIHVSHAEIDEDLGDDAWIISRRDSAIRSYGFLLAWRLGIPYVVTLDHDCYPHEGHEDLRGRHLRNLLSFPRWESSIPGLRIRGLPYGDTQAGLKAPVYPMLSVGLWSNVPDLDGACQLVNGVPPEFVPPPGVRLLPRHVYTPICGMNLAFRREFAPLAYFGLQGLHWPYRRFDDIWFGVVAKKICDHLDWSIAIGEPFVRHDRASDPFANLVKEAPGVQHHESFWRLIDGIPLSATTPVGCMREIGEYLAGGDVAYNRSLGKAMSAWAAQFEG